jgi:hypothetical protein
MCNGSEPTAHLGPAVLAIYGALAYLQVVESGWYCSRRTTVH